MDIVKKKITERGFSSFCTCTLGTIYTFHEQHYCSLRLLNSKRSWASVICMSLVDCKVIVTCRSEVRFICVVCFGTAGEETLKTDVLHLGILNVTDDAARVFLDWS